MNSVTLGHYPGPHTIDPKSLTINKREFYKILMNRIGKETQQGLWIKIEHWITYNNLLRQAGIDTVTVVDYNTILYC